MRHVPFDRLDQVWNQVVAPCELHIDLRECVFNPIALIDQIVIDADNIGNERDN